MEPFDIYNSANDMMPFPKTTKEPIVLIGLLIALMGWVGVLIALAYLYKYIFG